LETQSPFRHLPQAYLTVNHRLNYYYNARNKLNEHKSIFSDLFLHYEKLFIVNVENVSKSKIMKYTPELIREIKQMHEYSNQADFLSKYNIKTELELNDFEKSFYARINPLKSERENLWKKHKRAKTDEEKLAIENKIVEISKEIFPLTEDLKYCKQIQDRMQYYREEQLYQEMQNEKKHMKKELKSKKNVR
jgi:hypothetical protein